jgi:uncharacterized protein (DUF2252 family)
VANTIRKKDAAGPSPTAATAKEATVEEPELYSARTARALAGREARKRMPRASQADIARDDRPDPIQLLQGQAASRVQELVPIRYGRMLATPFTFYRGAAMVMASDLSRTPNSGLYVQLCGDAHLSNFGFFSTPERNLAFDINDFDETYPGPFEWDVKRLAASVSVAGLVSGHSAKTRRVATLASVAGYREEMLRLSSLGNLDVWYSHANIPGLLAEITSQLDRRRSSRTDSLLAKAKYRDNVDALRKLSTRVDGRTRIRSDPPLLVPIEELLDDHSSAVLYNGMTAMITSYRRTLSSDRRHLLDQFEFVQMARKVVGVGSVGTRAWILLFAGIDAGDPLFLQAKEAQRSVLAGYVKGVRQVNDGQRVVYGQRLLQATSDIFLGWQRVEGIDGKQRDFYVRQLRDGKASVAVEEMRPDGLAFYAKVCGQTLARGHARSGDRVAIASYLGSGVTFDNAISDFASDYTDLTVQDHADLQAAADDGRITATMGL